MEERVRTLELQFAREEARIGTTIKALSVGFAALIALWGYTNFVTVPAAAVAAINQSPFEEVVIRAAEATEAIEQKSAEAEKSIAELRSALSPYSARSLVVSVLSDTCPEHWVPFEPARGRYLVGALSSGEVGKLVGESLKDGENRSVGAHSHAYKYMTAGGDSPSKNNALAFAGGPHGALRKYPIEQTESSGDVQGTNAPYVTVLFCQPARSFPGASDD